jgi:hypothetical protein
MSKAQTVRLVGDTQRDQSHSKACAFCGTVFYRDKRCTWVHWGRAKYCSRDCAGAHIAAQKITTRKPRDDDFGRWFKRSEGCWDWQGAIDRDGYGIFSYAGKTYRAPRIAMEIAGRPLSAGEMACHRCDNPGCVRPDHLFAGTNQDNMKDMVRKGRNPDRFGDKNPNWRGATSSGRRGV